MDKLEALHGQLSGARVSDDMIARHVRLTAGGRQKLCAKLGCSDEELTSLLGELAAKLKGDMPKPGLININEADERFSFETDYMGNVSLRDSRTGAEVFLQGDDAFKLMHEIDRIGQDNCQSLLAPYFDATLMEFVEQDVHGDHGNSGGTYNFPYKGNFACARFYMSGNKPVVEVAHLVDGGGEEVPMDAATKADVNRVAWEWVDKV